MDFRKLFPSAPTAVYAMIGSPITQVKSPDFFNAYFREQGMDAELVAIDISYEELSGFFSFIRKNDSIHGCIVTVPHKQASLNFLNDASSRARALGAVNVISKQDGHLVGDMVDGLGFLAALWKHDFSIEGKRVALIGAGAAGSAIALAIAEGGANELVIREIDETRHHFLERLLKNANPKMRLSFEMENLCEFDLVINASTVGMAGDQSIPYPTDTLSARSLVADVVTSPGLTPWLQAARRKGCEVLYGSEMVYGQFALIGRHMGLSIPYSD